MTVEALARDLGSIWSERRIQAISGLVECGEPAVPVLLRVARRRWGRAPVGAIEALGLIGDPRACEVVRAAINRRPPRISQAAIVAAGRLRDAGASPILCELCAWPRSDGSRSLAVWALVEIGSPKALPTLLRLACTGSQLEREASRRGASRIGRQNPEQLAQHLPSPLLGAVAAGILCDLGEETLPALEAIAGSDSEPAAARALVLMGSMGFIRPEHRQRLIAMLGDLHPTFRTAAATSLAHLTRQTPDPQLRGAISGLQRCEKSSVSPVERLFYQDAIAAIEETTGHLKHLPLPVDSGADPTKHLPLPAGGNPAPDERLPVPAGDRA